MTLRSTLDLPLAAVLTVTTGCVGARTSLTLTELSYPVSASAYLFDTDGKTMVAMGDGLEVKSRYRHVKTYWGLLWSRLPLGDDRDIALHMNESIRSVGGEGMTDFAVSVTDCGAAIAYQVLLNILHFVPLLPGCARVALSGSIVARTPRTEPATPPTSAPGEAAPPEEADGQAGAQ